MYKKSADLVHFHKRAASHATKGSGRGTVWWNADDPEAFDRVEALKSLKKQYGAAMARFRAVLEMNADAVVRRDTPAIHALRPTIRTFSKNLKKMTKELDRLKILNREN